MEALIEQFKTWLIANSMKPNTIRSYTSHVRAFFAITKLTDVHNIPEQVVNEYFAKMKESKKQTTVNSHISALDQFLNFQKVTLRLPNTKTPPKKVVVVVPESDFLNEICPVVDLEFRNPLRHKAMFGFLYYCGLRIMDAAKVKREQFNLKEHYFLANIEKQTMEMKITIPESYMPLLIKYFASEAQENNAFNMSGYQMDRAFKKLKALLPHLKLHPHKFRKSCATNAKKLGMSIDEIQAMLGHKSILTTQIYVEVNQDVIREKFLRLEAEQLKKQRKEAKQNDKSH
jgi:integrase/recombinase XerD